jgi:hypothetical protein
MFRHIVHVLLKIIGGIVFGIAAAFLFGWAVMLLWNWLMPSLFGLPVIGFWKAWGLVILAHILFKSGHSPMGFHGRTGPHGRWKEKCHEKMKAHFHGTESAPGPGTPS